MARRRRVTIDTECSCGHAQGEECPSAPERCHHHYGCAYWGADIVNPSGEGLKPHKSLLGSPRTPYAKWQATFSPYTWPLWRNWKPPKPTLANGLLTETPAEVNARLCNVKPRYHPPGCACVQGGDQTGCVPYSWKVAPPTLRREEETV